MKKVNILIRLSFPPLYFFAGIGLMVISYFIFPEYNLHYFPYNSGGLLPVIFGAYFIVKYTIVFNTEKTTLQNTKPSHFVKDGFYRYSRNPMYLGGLLFLLGLAVFLGNLLSLFILLFFFLIMNFICIPVEEKIMEETFREEYEKYKKIVRRWL